MTFLGMWLQSLLFSRQAEMMTKEPERAKYLVFHVMTTSQSPVLTFFEQFFHLKTWILLLIHKKDSNTIKLFGSISCPPLFCHRGDLCIKEREYLCLLICNEIKEEYAEIWASQVALVLSSPIQET